MTTPHFTSAADARQFIFAAAGLVIGRAALRAIGQDAEQLLQPEQVHALEDAAALRIAGSLRTEMSKRYPGIFPPDR